MQTLLPYADFERSARSLDARRIGKRRVECLQVVRGLTVPGYGWRHHPAVLMGRDRLEALGRYSLTCCEVRTETGRADTCTTPAAARPQRSRGGAGAHAGRARRRRGAPTLAA